MIDWFPTTARMQPDEAARDLGRWRGMLTLRRVAREVDARDPATAGHSDRVAGLCSLLAAELGWSHRQTATLRQAASIHDVGKACLPVEILLAPRRLTPEEYEIVKEHAVLGSKIARSVVSPAQLAWVRSHHERWDGRGYPDGLADREIPHGAAILCVADAWDAMIHRSWTGTALTEGEALEECRRESGMQFSPEVVDALERVLEANRLAPRRPVASLRLVPAA
jgi:HD-GYP domain-containing protein (c-di-GMP phosphodiesterase class II)